MALQMGRNVGRRIASFASSSIRLVFGPFEVGASVPSMYVYLGTTTAYDSSASGCLVPTVDIRAFGAAPANTSASFATGRPLCSGAGNDPLLPPFLPLVPHGSQAVGGLVFVGWAGGSFELPLSWIARESERFLGVEFTEAQGIALQGSAWVNVQVDEVLDECGLSACDAFDERVRVLRTYQENYGGSVPA